jgi:beta-lactamase regulating signal transducer with metallopeptidase domain/HEAT repeat protein
MMMSTFITTLTQPAVVAWLIKATALLVAALAATSLLRRASAGTRHLVWLATLAGILLLPAVSLSPALRLAILPSQLVPALPTVTTYQSAPAAPVRDVIVPPAATGSPANVTPLPAAAPRTDRALPNVTHMPVWAMLLAAWGVVAAALLGWLAFGALSVRRIVRSGRELDERSWTAPLCEIADRLDLDAVPRLLSSPLIEMPFACGVLEPTVVLPASAEGWNDSRRRAVLFHELAHVKRHDLVGHTLGRIACALYWFHPLVWTAARCLRAESERACDDLVLSCGARASDYADHLLDIVISVRHHGAPATAMPMARRRELEGRVLAILDPAVVRIGPGRMQSVSMLAGVGALALTVAAMAPARTSKPSLERLSLAGDSVARSARVKSSQTQTQTQTNTVTSSSNHTSRVVDKVSIASDPTPASSPAPSANRAPAPAPAPTPSPSVAEPVTIADALGAVGKVAVREAAAAVSGVLGGHAKILVNGKPAVDSAKIALLLKVLRTDPDANVRKMAAWGLSEAGDVLGATDALAEAVRSDEDDDVREMAAWALADSHRDVARRALAAALRRDPSEHVRETAVWGLGNAGLRDDDREVVEAALASDESEGVRESAAWALGNTPRRPAAPALVTALRDRSPEVRESAAWALAEIEDEDAAPAVQSAFGRETNPSVRMAELRALTFMHVDDRTILDAALASKDAELRARAVRMLAGSGGSWPEPRPRPRPRPMP